MGSQTVFIDNANEKHNMVLLKHFTEKNQAAVVDIKTRKRKTGELGHSAADSSVSVCRVREADRDSFIGSKLTVGMGLRWILDSDNRILWAKKKDMEKLYTGNE